MIISIIRKGKEQSMRQRTHLYPHTLPRHLHNSSSCAYLCPLTWFVSDLKIENPSRFDNLRHLRNLRNLRNLHTFHNLRTPVRTADFKYDSPEMAGPSPQSCSECRKAKRKCSGDVPSCDRCQKQGRQCQYPRKTPHMTGVLVSNGPSSTDQGDKSRSQDVPGADEARRSIDGCAIYFLDADLFVRKGISITTSKFNIPADLLNSVHEILVTFDFDLDLYFQSIHTYFPISNHAPLSV